MMTEQDKPNDTIGEPQGDTASESPSAGRVTAVEGDVFCPDCGYNLRTLTSDRCPECGGDVRIVRERESQIPWVHRAKIGRVRAYWKTVWLVIFKNRKFCTEMARPANLSAARRFRWVTVLLAYLPLVAAAASLFHMRVIPWTFDAQVCTAIAAVMVFALLAMVPAVPYYAFRHRDLSLVAQHRGAVLMNYLCAPMALTWVALVCGVVGWFVTRQSSWWRDASLVLYLITGSFLGVVIAVTLVDTARLVKKAIGDQGISRRINMKLGLFQFAAVLVCLVALPVVGLWLAFILCDLVL